MESYGLRVEMRCGKKCRQATSASRTLFVMLRNLDYHPIDNRAPDTPYATARPSSARLHSYCLYFHNFGLLFILFLQLQMPALPGKMAFIVLCCRHDNIELLLLNLA